MGRDQVLIVWLQLSLALTASAAVALSLEDPFDNSGVDGIFVGEAFSEVEQVRW